MRSRRTPSINRVSHRLDALLAMALELAIERRYPEVAESVLCALEAHTRATGCAAALDSAYLRIFAKPGQRRAIRRAGNRCAER